MAAADPDRAKNQHRIGVSLTRVDDASRYDFSMSSTTESTAGESTTPYLERVDDNGSNATDVNVGEAERLASLFGGVGLVVAGLHRRSLGGLVLAVAGGALAYRGYSGSCGLYKKLGLTSAKPAEPQKYFDHGIHVETSITIDATPERLYAFWRQLDNLPQFMSHLESVEVIDEKRSKWVAKGPAGSSVRWEAEVINDEPNRLIAWRSLAGAHVDNAGSVRFVDGPPGRGTELRVTLDYIPPGRSVGAWVARLLGEDPKRQIETDLRRLKQILETGEVTTSQSSTLNEPVQQ